ncbi:MAG: hypothetical protein Q9194_003052 [Teloschistes cf. exilis]
MSPWLDWAIVATRRISRISWPAAPKQSSPRVTWMPPRGPPSPPNIPTFPVFASLQELLAECTPDFALVCVPHQFHLQCVQLLSSVGIPVLKEKPAADSQSQFDQLLEMPVKIGVAFQKRFEPRYVQLEKLLPLVGDVASFRAVLTMNIKDLDATWRANTGVGVTEDLGCHPLNIIVWLFGRPTSLVAHQVDSVRQFQTCSGDDVSNSVVHWKSSSIVGHVHLSRVAHTAEESITITGTNGTLRLDGDKVVMLDISGSQLLEMVDTTSKRTIIGTMHRKLGDYATGRATEYPGSLGSLADTVAVGEAIQKPFATHQTQDLPAVSPTSVASLNGVHHVWPLITSESTDAVVKQTLSSLSIYDRSNIYQVFEDRWQEMHGLKHALTCSSGTIAIFHWTSGQETKYFALSIPSSLPTPILQYGAIPVFCDALSNGNIGPSEILNKATPKTRAVVVTHMWGLPCDVPKVMENAQKVNGGIKVLEDCSHAHGASIGDRLVGTWGHMSAWSLQAKKNVTGGQAGVCATNDTDYYAHAILHGHFNKRAKQDSTTATPPQEILPSSPSWMTHREKYATYLAKKLAAIPFLSMPTSTKSPQHKHAWYAFVMQFRAEKAPPDLSREQFVKALEAHGLSEVDIPRSTGLLNELPMFSHTHEATPRYGDGPWHDPQPNEMFPTALAFYERAIKLPMWATPAD